MSRKFGKKSARARGKRNYKGSALEAYNLARKAGKKYKRGKRGGGRGPKAYTRKRRSGKYRRSGAPRAKKYGMFTARSVFDRRFANRIAERLKAVGYTKADAKHLAANYVERQHALERLEAAKAAKGPLSAERREAALNEVAKEWVRKHGGDSSSAFGVLETAKLISELEAAAKDAR